MDAVFKGRQGCRPGPRFKTRSPCASLTRTTESWRRGGPERKGISTGIGMSLGKESQMTLPLSPAEASAPRGPRPSRVSRGVSLRVLPAWMSAASLRPQLACRWLCSRCSKRSKHHSAAQKRGPRGELWGPSRVLCTSLTRGGRAVRGRALPGHTWASRVPHTPQAAVRALPLTVGVVLVGARPQMPAQQHEGHGEGDVHNDFQLDAQRGKRVPTLARGWQEGKLVQTLRRIIWHIYQG